MRSRAQWPFIFSALSATRLLAQPCAIDWSKQFTAEGPTRAWITAAAVFDADGSGPQGPALFASGPFCAAGATTVAGIARWDGSRWSPLGQNIPGAVSPIIYAMAVFDDDGPGPHASALIVAGFDRGNYGTHFIMKWDGTSWSPIGSLFDVHCLLVHDDDGPGPILPALYAGNGGGVWRWDGAAWTALGHRDVNVQALVSFDRDGPGPQLPQLVSGGWGTGANVAAWNGTTWIDLGLTGSDVHALIVHDDDGPGPRPATLFAGGTIFGGGSGVARLDPNEWVSLGEGISVNSVLVEALAVFDDDGEGPLSPVLYASGGFDETTPAVGNGIARWDGQSWSSPAEGIHRNSYVTVLLPGIVGNGPLRLYAGGWMTMAGNADASGLAAWNGQNWEPCIQSAGGLSAPARAIAVGRVDNDPRESLYIVGDFQRAGSVPVGQVARWDGSSWSSLEGGVSLAGGYLPTVETVTMADLDGTGPEPIKLIVGGSFDRAGTVPAHNVAAWDGQHWSALNSGLGSTPIGAIHKLLLYSPSAFTTPILWAGGSEDDPNSALHCGLAWWDGAQWRSAFPGAFGGVRLMAVHDDDGPGPHPPALYVGGSIPIAGTPSLARWDGVSWTPLPDFGGTLEDLASFDPDGDGPAPALLYAAGYLNAPVNGLKFWNGSGWTSISIPGLTPYSNTATGLFPIPARGDWPPALYVTGTFRTSSGLNTNLVRWNGSTWQLLFDFPGLGPRAAALFDEDGPGPLSPALYFAGEIDVAGSHPSAHFARMGCSNCYANCDNSAAQPFLTANDFQCFFNAFAALSAYANCDSSTVPPILTANDFQCFLNKFAAGCP